MMSLSMIWLAMLLSPYVFDIEAEAHYYILFAFKLNLYILLPHGGMDEHVQEHHSCCLIYHCVDTSKSEVCKINSSYLLGDICGSEQST